MIRCVIALASSLFIANSLQAQTISITKTTRSADNKTINVEGVWDTQGKGLMQIRVWYKKKGETTFELYVPPTDIDFTAKTFKAQITGLDAKTTYLLYPRIYWSTTMPPEMGSVPGSEVESEPVP